MMNTSDENGQCYLVLDLRRTAFHYFSAEYNVSCMFVIDSYNYIKELSFYPHFINS